MKLCLGCFNSAKAVGPSTYFPVVFKVCSPFFLLPVILHTPS